MGLWFKQLALWSGLKLIICFIKRSIQCNSRQECFFLYCLKWFEIDLLPQETIYQLCTICVKSVFLCCLKWFEIKLLHQETFYQLGVTRARSVYFQHCTIVSKAWRNYPSFYETTADKWILIEWVINLCYHFMSSHLFQYR